MKKGFLSASLAVILTASAVYSVSIQNVHAANESNKNVSVAAQEQRLSTKGIHDLEFKHFSKMQEVENVMPLAFSKDITNIVATSTTKQDKSNNISDVIVVQDNVPYYEERTTDSDIFGELNAGDKIKMYGVTPNFVTTEIDGVVRYVETRYIDLSTSKLDKNALNDLWKKMRDLGITPAGKYTSKVPTTKPKEPPVEPEKPTEQPVKPTELSKNKDTATFVYLKDEEENEDNPYRIKALDYNVNTSTKLYSKASTSSTVLATISEGETLKVSSTNQKFVAEKRKSVNEWLEVMHNGQKAYVKRQDISTNYKVYISPSASKWNYNEHNSNGITNDNYYPDYNSGSYVTINNIMHDPIYDLLKAGTSVSPSAITNSSVLKPKAGTGASTTSYIPSTGTASGDGWKAPTYTKNYESGLFKSVLHRDLGFRNTWDHMGVVFETTDGSRLDVLAVDPAQYKAIFEVKGLTKKEGYRIKEMLKIVIPFFLDKSISSEGAKVHTDFIAYTQSSSSVEKATQYKGFKAKFVKTATDTYELRMY